MSTAEIIKEIRQLNATELAQIQAEVRELVESRTSQAPASAQPTPGHPALGIWKDRADLPEDSVEASKLLRQRMMKPADSLQS